jgi:hypothetical protein
MSKNKAVDLGSLDKSRFLSLANEVLRKEQEQDRVNG